MSRYPSTRRAAFTSSRSTTAHARAKQRKAGRAPGAGVCGRQGTSGMHHRGFHYLIFILMVTRILLIALISSRTAAAVGVRSGSYVVGQSGGKGPPRGCGAALSLSPWIHRSGSQAVNLLPWIEGEAGSTYFSGVNSPVLGDNLTSWDRKPDPSSFRSQLMR